MLLSQAPSGLQMADNGTDDDVQIEFCTLGMFIIDEIHFSDSKSSVDDVVGGAGSYAALGARLFSPPPLSRSVGWIVDCGSDFPAKVENLIKSWNTKCLMRATPERLTTRGWNEYGDNEYRAFKYLSPKLRLDANSCSSSLIRSKCFHLICSSARCIELVGTILARRQQECAELRRPIFVWEPVPDVCSPEELDICDRALKMVDVVSPNHVEIAAFYGQTGEKEGRVHRQAVEQYAAQWLQTGIGPASDGKIVVRCGKEGCYAADTVKSLWLPAYHNVENKVIDPTGGGNTFLGAMSIALARGFQLKEAVIWGSVGASFAIEQIGVPAMQENANGELWNAESVHERLKTFRSGLE